jgi:hypothetical protein
MRDAVESVPDSTIQYHALVDMQGLATLIDALDGIDIDYTGEDDNVRRPAGTHRSGGAATLSCHRLRFTCRIRTAEQRGTTTMHVHLSFAPARLSCAVGCSSVRQVDTGRSTSTDSSTVVSWVALASAGVAAAMLWIADTVWYGIPDSSGPAVSLLFLGGWGLLACAVLLAVGVLIHLAPSAMNRRGVRPLEFVLPAATVVLVAGILLSHPLAGSAVA